MNRLRAVIAALVLLVGEAVLPLLACLCAPDPSHACCCEEARADVPQWVAAPMDCCDDGDAAHAPVAPTADLARAAAPLLFAVLPAPAAWARLAADVVVPVAPMTGRPRGPPKIPIFLQVEALLR